MNILGIESSCDDTACAVVRDGDAILSSVVSSQETLHARFGGIVPEVACRRHIDNILPVLDSAMRDADLTLSSIDAIAVTSHPGLIGALVIGMMAAKALSWAFDIPLIAVNHLHAHIYGGWLGGGAPSLPAISLVVSGGHTNLYLTKGPLDHELLGCTADDAAGEAFDKVANILQLGFPGGPAVEEAAKEGRDDAVDLPRAWMEEGNCDFSFSGLKTAVLYHCLGQNASKQDIKNASYPRDLVCDVAASFQKAVIDVVVYKTIAAAEKYDAESIIVGGGVAANSLLRQMLGDMASDKRIELNLTPLALCRDNAAIVGGIAYHMFNAGMVASLDAEASP
jgi:N6-L-threonylcarbamoyladenine synthase